MALLSRVALALSLAAAGCYDPATPSCTVTCTTGDTCARGQTCAGGFCVDDGATCTGAGPDAGGGPAPTSSITIAIAGHGHVVFGSETVCDSEAAAGTCTVRVPQHVPVHVTAVPASDSQFQSWAGACTGMQPTCDFTPAMPALMLAPKFK